MINYKENYIFNFLEKKALRGFSSFSSCIFYDKRIKEVFRKQLSISVKPIKYYFTDSTMKRVLPIDLANCYPTKLGYLSDKYPDEFGLCICKLDNIGFIYQIGLNDIKIIVTSGTNKSGNTTIDEFGRIDYSAWNKTIVGSAIISFDSDKVSIMPNNTLSFILNGKLEFAGAEMKSEILKIAKSMKKIADSEKTLLSITKNDDLRLFNLVEDIKIKEAKIWTAIKMFIFLKTANVVDKTFISDSKICVKGNTAEKENEGIIVVDSTWDSSIHVINPFSVSGHFRYQPKKNEKKEWYKEVIYIDSFMKTGYNRRAKIDTDCALS